MNSKTTLLLRSGNKIPLLGLGTWLLKKDTAEMIKKALGLGYRMIDTSGDYGTQRGVGEGIKQSGILREDIFVVTKVEEIDDAYSASLKNVAELQLDYVDLMLIHRPPRKGVGEDLWHGLIKAKQEGYAKDIGVSNYSAEQIQTLADITGEMPVVNQIEWSPFGHSEEMLEFAQQNNIIIQAYSPLTRTKRLNDPTLKEIAANYGKSPAQILIRWNLQLGTVPLPKASQLQHQEENINVFDFEINNDDMATLNGLNEQYSSLGILPYIYRQIHR